MKELPKFLERKSVRQKFVEVWIIKKHNLETLKKVIAKYPDLLDFEDSNQNLTDHLIGYAVKYGFNKGIEFLLEKIKPEQIEKIRREMLEKAIIWEHPETLKFLIKKLGLKKEDHRDLIKACFQKSQYSRQFVCRKEMLEILFENGVDVHTENDLALKLACRRGCVNLVKWLVEEKGANVNAERDKDEIYLEPILEALQTFHEVFKYKTETEASPKEATQIVKFLLKHGANPAVSHSLGWLGILDPLKDITRYGKDIEVLQMLLKSFKPSKKEIKEIEELLEEASWNSFVEVFIFLTEFLMKTCPTWNITQIALRSAIKAFNVEAMIYCLKQDKNAFDDLFTKNGKKIIRDIENILSLKRNNPKKFPEIIEKILEVLPNLAKYLSKKEVDEILKNLIKMEKIELAEKFYEPLFIMEKKISELERKESELEIKIHQLQQEKNKILQEKNKLQQGLREYSL